MSDVSTNEITEADASTNADGSTAEAGGKKKAAAKKKVKSGFPNLLAFERGLYPTDGLFHSRDHDGVLAPIAIVQKTVLGTESQFNPDESTVPEHGNPQRVEAATLPTDAEHLVVTWRLSVAPVWQQPVACDEPTFRSKIERFTGLYRDLTGMRELGSRYALNIANGRWAWRNRALSSSFTVKVSDGESTWLFDAFSFDLDNMQAAGDVSALGDVIAKGLAGPSVKRLSIEGVLNIGAGAQVYPSQEFSEKDDDGESRVGRVLFGVKTSDCARCAAFHEQKIGNALRTIDTWHTGAGMVLPGRPLAVNPYAQDRGAYTVVRRGTGSETSANLYELMKGIDAILDSLDEGRVSDEAHFVAANLVRGGVFGFGKE